MSLTFANTTDTVNCGSGASLDSLSTLTFLIWVKPLVNVTTNVGLMGKGTTGGANRRSFELSGTTNGAFNALIGNATGPNNASATSAASLLSVGTWAFLGTTYDDATKNAPLLYMGTLSTIAALMTPSISANGSAAAGNNDSLNQYIGGFGSGNTGGTNKAIAWAGIWNRVMTLAEIQAQQFFRRVTSGCVLFMHLGYAGTGTQPDWSGNANSGSVTGATVSDHAPIRAPFGADAALLYKYRGRIFKLAGEGGGLAGMPRGLAADRLR